MDPISWNIYLSIYLSIYIYIYISRERERESVSVTIQCSYDTLIITKMLTPWWPLLGLMQGALSFRRATET